MDTLFKQPDHQSCIRWVGSLLATALWCAPTLAAPQTQAAPDSAPATPVVNAPVAKASANDAPAAAAETPAKQPASVVVKPGDGVEIHVVDVPLTTVLRMLSTQSRRNIIASAGVQGTVTADLYDVSFQEALDSILTPNNCGYTQRGNFIHVYTLKELGDQQATTNGHKLTVRLFHLNYVSTEDIEPMIKPLLSQEGKIAAMPSAGKGGAASGGASGGGGSSSGGSSGGGGSEGGGVQLGPGNLLSRPDAIVVSDYPDRLAQVEKIIRELDIRPRQVLVEATIMRASLGETNTLGIDFNVLGGVDFEDLNGVSPGVTDLAVGVVPQPHLQRTNWTTRTDFNDLVPKGGFSFGIIHNDVAAFIRALESVTDATVIANPKVLTLNKQEGHVIVGRRDGYITTTITETTATQTVEFLETGTRLFFRPFISDDGFVRLEIHPEDSSGGLNDQNLPFKRTTEVTSNIMVRDGCTVLIGGLFREALSTNRSQVPYVGSIPVAGTLFQTNSDTTEREEVIILLTVHVVKEDIYAAKSADLAKDADRICAGMRKGMQWYGRNRLAQAHYRWAVEHAQAGNTDRALWDARLATYLCPTNLPALKLKDQLQEKEGIEQNEGCIRDFILRRLQEPLRDASEPNASPPALVGPPAPAKTERNTKP